MLDASSEKMLDWAKECLADPEGMIDWVGRCVATPDIALATAQGMVEDDPAAEKQYLVHASRFLALGRLALDRAEEAADGCSSDAPELCVESIKEYMLARGAEDSTWVQDQETRNVMDWPLFESHLDGVAIVLEKARPKSVQRLLGKTKLLYLLMADRLSHLNVLERQMRDNELLRADVRSLCEMFVEAPFEIGCALVASHLEGGTISCKLFEELEPFGPDDKQNPGSILIATKGGSDAPYTISPVKPILTTGTPGVVRSTPGDGTNEQSIEREIPKRAGLKLSESNGAPFSAIKSVTEIQETPNSSAAPGTAPVTRCTKCGKPVQAEARFCTACGTASGPTSTQTAAPSSAAAKDLLHEAIGPLAADDYKAAMPLLQKALALGLAPEDAVFARWSLSEGYREVVDFRLQLPKMVEANEFRQCIVEIEKAFDMDRRHSLGFFSEPLHIGCLGRIDAMYTLASRSKGQQQGIDAAITYLAAKLRLVDYLKRPPLLASLLELAQLYQRKGAFEDASQCLREIIDTEPLYPADEEGHQKLRGSALQMVSEIKRHQQPTSRASTAAPAWQPPPQPVTVKPAAPEQGGERRAALFAVVGTIVVVVVTAALLWRRSEPPRINSPESSVRQVIGIWVASFKQMDAVPHSDCYAQLVERYFRRKNVTHDQIRRYKEQAFQDIAEVRRYEVSDITVNPIANSNRYEARFRKVWDTPLKSRRDSSGEEIEKLTFAPYGNDWKIVAEEELRVIRSSSGTSSEGPTASRSMPTDAPDDGFAAFYGRMRSAAGRRDQVALSNLMSPTFHWTLDGDVTRDKALDNIGSIIGWQKFWQSASLALAKPAITCKPHYCDDRTGYETFAKNPFPLEMLFERGSSGQWHWSGVLGD